MIDFFNNDEWQKLFEKWTSEAEEYTEKKKKFDRFIQLKSSIFKIRQPSYWMRGY